MRHALEVKVGDWMRDLLGDARATRKRPYLTERVSKSRHLEELHKLQTRDKNGQYVDFHSEEFWMKFHEARQKVEEEAAATGAAMPDDIQLISGLEVGHLRAERSWVATGLPPCCLEAKWRIMRWVKAVVSSVYTAFNEHMRRFTKQSHLTYTLMPPIMDIVRATVPSISLLTVIAAGTLDARGCLLLVLGDCGCFKLRNISEFYME
ncbi:hypothetical protein M9H77_22870 [Catharanthus roseus]|uniref:Uncharacterized protein n=1 Tax=Catharanthus roseus TaxID=4058 RepID=A0ACC0ASY0_CATRO|nr:hypothetical protein M9H77_22870 [Catharanthus roseus]